MATNTTRENDIAAYRSSRSARAGYPGAQKFADGAEHGRNDERARVIAYLRAHGQPTEGTDELIDAIERGDHVK